MAKGNGTGRLDYMDSIRWAAQGRERALGWIFGVKRADHDAGAAYSAGYDKGWADAMGALAMHGVIVRFDKKADGSGEV